ncbi:hypothetical protein CRM90_23030 [Mycobacterium sp. ENV421]|nr:hypothetical protein CRM90_23030 [Mycobacterium sp. ENV421]
MVTERADRAVPSRRVAASTANDSGSVTGADGSPLPLSRSSGRRLATEIDAAGFTDAAGVDVGAFGARGPALAECRGAGLPAEDVVLPEPPAPLSAPATAGSATINPPTPRATANAPTRPM